MVSVAAVLDRDAIALHVHGVPGNAARRDSACSVKCNREFIRNEVAHKTVDFDQSLPSGPLFRVAHALSWLESIATARADERPIHPRCQA